MEESKISNGDIFLTGCEYKSANRQVFIIHQAFVHSELKMKLEQSGQDISLGEPLGMKPFGDSPAKK